MSTIEAEGDADVVVIGAGPAGCACAIVLAEAGQRVVVFARAPLPGDRAGESLSPGGPALLDRLGLRTHFLEDGHLPCHANASAWGSAELTWSDFLRDPRGPGYHIDRARFEARLRERAAAVGARLLEGDAPRLQRGEDRAWSAEASSAHPALRARWIVDASGRAQSFARSQGARRELAWEQVALVAFARATRPISEQFTLIEAVPEGFWYSAPIPGQRFAVALFTDAAQHDARRDHCAATLGALLARSSHTRLRLFAHDATLDGAPRFVDAGSARLAVPHGDGWIAVGDAALTFDPISAHGLTLALRTGVDAAAAILADAAGDAAALSRYGSRLGRAFDEYRSEALRIFRSEQRWPDAPYWKKRHAI